jgi:hypothetical protein
MGQHLVSRVEETMLDCDLLRWLEVGEGWPGRVVWWAV